MRASFVLPAALAAAMLASLGCGPPVDLTQALEVEELSTGWHDAGLVDGNNKLVPSVTFRLRNKSTETLVTLQVNAMFRRVTEAQEWGSGFRVAAGSDGLAPGAATTQIVIHSQRGYTGSEPRAEMLKNSHFVDAKVELYAKYAANEWQPLGVYPIERALLAP